MIDSETVLEQVRRQLRREPRIDFDHQAVSLTFANGELLLSGEVGDIAAKRLAVERAAIAPPVTAVIDELRVRPEESLPDGEIRDLVCNALVGETALTGCTIRKHVGPRFEAAHSPLTHIGQIDIRVTRGVVMLAGAVPSLAQKRLAGVLAWWCPGTRDVANGLDVNPPEEDSDEHLGEAVKLVLDRDLAIHSAAIRVSGQDGWVTLDGAVPAPSERAAAERDTWLVLGVREVVNHLAVCP